MRSRALVYLAGGISGLSIEEHNSWRLDFQKFIWDAGIANYISIFNPVDHIEDLHPNRMNNKQAMDYDLGMLRKADLVIMNFNNPNSIGTACELGISYEKRIPVLGLNLSKYELHPWQCMICEKIFTDWESMIDYFIKHYANEWM